MMREAKTLQIFVSHGLAAGGDTGRTIGKDKGGKANTGMAAAPTSVSPTLACKKELFLGFLEDFAKSSGKDVSDVLLFAQGRGIEPTPLQPADFSSQGLEDLLQEKRHKEKQLVAAHARGAAAED